MTYAEKFYSILSNDILSIVSYIGEGFCILSVILIMICFLGIDGSFTRKTVIPVMMMIGAVSVLNLYCICHDYFILKGVWNETYVEGRFNLADKSDFALLIYSLVIIVIVITSLWTFKKYRVLNCFILGVMMVIYESYISIEMKCAAMYFSEKPGEYVLKTDISEQLLGAYSYFFTISYLVIMLSLFLALYFGMYKNQRTMYVGWKNRIIFCVWELLMVCIMYVPIMGGLRGVEQVRYMGYELGIIMPVMSIAVPILLVMSISRRYVLEKTIIQEDYITAELNYINQYKKNQEETRTFRHDIINNLSVLSAIHNEKNYEEAQEYLNTLLGDVCAMSPKYNTGDEMLDCIVGMKSSKMEEEGIDFAVEGIIEGGLGMKPVDICSIFANALDNAIEACEKLSEDSSRWIKLVIKKTDKFYSIILSNTMVDNEKNVISGRLFSENERITTKKDRSLHGYGTQIIKSTVSEYNGMENAGVKDGVFSLNIIIPRNV